MPATVTVTSTFDGIDKKLERAEVHIQRLSQQITAFTDRQPYSVRVSANADPTHGKIGRLIAVKNPSCDEPDINLVLLAGEALYQLRSALDHVVHQLVILNGQGHMLPASRRHQFPIFETSQGYQTRARAMIAGVSAAVAEVIESEQPYNKHKDNPKRDPLWILQDLNNTDKHRLVPINVVGIGEVRGYDSKGHLFSLGSPDIALEDNEIFWSFTLPDGRYDDIRAEVDCAIAFQQAMEIGGNTVSMDTVLWHITLRIQRLIDLFRSSF